MLADPVGEERPSEQIGQEVWIRLVDPPSGEIIPIPEHFGGIELSPDAQRMALFNIHSFFIASFSDGQFLSRWGTSSYDLSPAAWSPWSPDSKWLVVYGIHLDTGEIALFILTP